jgi:uncharacterized protein YllA (UPF0747 family)
LSFETASPESLSVGFRIKIGKRVGRLAFLDRMKFEDLTARAEIFRGRTADRDLIRILSGRKAESPQIAENIHRMGRPDAVVVLADLYPGLFGGPVCQVLKCLTAIKICEQLAMRSINAVPVAWNNLEASSEFPGQSITLLDAHAEIHSLKLSAARIVPESISGLLAQIEDLGKGAFDPETLDVLRDSFLPGRSLTSATACLFSELTRDFGMVVIDPSELSTKVTGTDVLPLDSVPHAWPWPLTWPQVSATIGDTRSRRTFDKYYLDLSQLYQGESDWLDHFKRGLPRAGLEKLEDLQLEVDARIADLRSLVSGGTEFLQAAGLCREKVLYQINKLRHLFDAALKSKEQTAARRIRRACNLMAPNRKLQERELAGIHIPLTYSLAGLRELYEKMDIMNFEHQLIWMD